MSNEMWNNQAVLPVSPCSMPFSDECRYLVHMVAFEFCYIFEMHKIKKKIKIKKNDRFCALSWPIDVINNIITVDVILLSRFTFTGNWSLQFIFHFFFFIVERYFILLHFFFCTHLVSLVTRVDRSYFLHLKPKKKKQ